MGDPLSVSPQSWVHFDIDCGEQSVCGGKTCTVLSTAMVDFVYAENLVVFGVLMATSLWKYTRVFPPAC